MRARRHANGYPNTAVCGPAAQSQNLLAVPRIQGKGRRVMERKRIVVVGS